MSSLLRGTAFITGAAKGKCAHVLADLGHLECSRGVARGIMPLMKLAIVSAYTATSGIGRATAEAFARHGISRLALADIDMQGLNKTKEIIKAQCPDAKVLELQLDVRHSGQVKDGLAEIAKKFGRLDIAVNNAGVAGLGKKTHEMTDEEWAGVADVDLFGVWRCQKEELAAMIEQE